MSRIVFKPELTFGTLLQLAGIMGTLIGTIVYFNVQQERTRMALEETQKSVGSALQKIERHDDALSRLAITQERITAIIEERRGKL